MLHALFIFSLLLLSSIPIMNIQQLVYPFSCLWIFELFSIFDFYKIGCYEHSCISLLWTYIFISPEYMSRCGISAKWDRCVFNLIRNYQNSSPKRCYHFILSAAVLLTLHLHLHLVLWGFFAHSRGYEIVSHYCFDLHFLDDWWGWASFHCKPHRT